MISFALGGDTGTTPQLNTQLEATGKTYKRRDGIEPQHYLPPVSPDHTGGVPPGNAAEAAAGTLPGQAHYSGFNHAINKWGVGTEASVAQELKWQQDMDGD
jgi:hypothetical protein